MGCFTMTSRCTALPAYDPPRPATPPVGIGVNHMTDRPAPPRLLIVCRCSRPGHAAPPTARRVGLTDL